MKKIDKAELETLAMVCGGEKRHPLVIICGELCEWVGIGWIRRGKATARDMKKYPTATEAGGAK